VVILGPGLTADDWAQVLETINYEVVCMIGQRVPRVYLREGKAIGMTEPDCD